MELELRSVERQGAQETGGVPRGVGAPPDQLVAPRWPPPIVLFANILLYSGNNLHTFSANSRTFISAQK